MEIEGFNFSEVRRFKPPGVFFMIPSVIINNCGSYPLKGQIGAQDWVTSVFSGYDTVTGDTTNLKILISEELTSCLPRAVITYERGFHPDFLND